MHTLDFMVRDGKKVHPTCPECGCRLVLVLGRWIHFMAFSGRDARGCRCSMSSIPMLIMRGSNGSPYIMDAY